MCGIAGLIDFSQKLGPERLRAIASDMADALVHRGPDDHGVWVDPTGYCALSNRRLSIIDTSPAGHQPMLAPGGSACITFNGEIYNFGELRSTLQEKGCRFRTHTDTEVLLAAVRLYGDEVYAILDGMYAFAYFDAVARELVLTRDPFGEKPLYYMEWPGGFAFASELQALAQLPNFTGPIDDDAIGEYLTLQYVHPPRTIYRGVRKLEPGHRLRVRPNGQLSFLRHFSFTPAETEFSRPRRLDELAEELEPILVESVRRRLISDVPLGALLSGGVDSSLVVAVAAKLLGAPIRTFTLGFAGSTDSEAGCARRVAERLCTDHREKELTPEALALAPLIGGALDEPNGDSSCLPTYFLSEFARQEVTVTLSGDGGDELFGGYERYLSTLAQNSLSGTRSDASKAYFSTGLLVFSESDAMNLLGELSPATRELLSSFGSRIDDPSQPLVNAMRRLDATTYLPGAVLAKVDRMSMRHSLEVRAPLLSRDVARFAEKLDPGACISDGQGKLVLKRLAAKSLPMSWLTRKKTGFGLPLAEWDSEEFRRLAQDMLLEPGALVQTWIERARLKRFFARQEILAARSLPQIWSLIILETWLRSHRVTARSDDARPARVAFLTPEFVTERAGEGGLSTYVARMSRILTNMGHEAEVFTPSRYETGSVDFDGVRVHRVPVGEDRFNGRRRGLRRLVAPFREVVSSVRIASRLARAFAAREREVQFDFVQCSDYGLTGLFVEKRIGRPLLVRCSWARDLFSAVDGTRTLGSRILASLERMTVRRADRAYAPSEFLAGYISRTHGLRLDVLRPPFYLESRPASYVPAAVPPRYLIHFGLIGPRKGSDVLADALPIAWREEPELTMVWAGREHSAGVLEQYRARWGDLARQVTWLGPLPTPVLYAVLKRAVAAVLPSRCDNLPNTVIESILFGVPVIGSLGASIDELVRPGVDGELIPIGNREALAEALVASWRRNSDFGVRLSREAPPLPEMRPLNAAWNLLELGGVRVLRDPSRAPRDAPLSALRLPESPVLYELVPSSTPAGRAFNRQPNGSSALSVVCANASPDTTVVFGSMGLPTVYGGPTWLTCEVPSYVYDDPADWDVYLISGAGESGRVRFKVGA